MRVWPKSLRTRTALVVCTTLLVSHLAGLIIYFAYNATSLTHAREQRTAEQIAIIARILERIPAERHDEIIRQLSRKGFRLSIDAEPRVRPDESRGTDTEPLRNLLNIELDTPIEEAVLADYRDLIGDDDAESGDGETASADSQILASRVGKFGRFRENLYVSLKIDTTHGGEFRLASGAGHIELPRVFREPLELLRLDSRVRWRKSEEDWLVQAADIEAVSRDGRVEGELELRLPHDPQLSPVLKLRAGLRDGNGAHAARYYPLILPEGLRAYLEHAVVSGRVTEATVELHGALRNFPLRNGKGRVEVRAHVEDGVFESLPDWAPIEAIEADLQFTGTGMLITGREGRIRQLQAGRVTVAIDDFKAPGGQVVQVNGRTTGPRAARAEHLDLPERARGGGQSCHRRHRSCGDDGNDLERPGHDAERADHVHGDSPVPFHPSGCHRLGQREPGQNEHERRHAHRVLLCALCFHGHLHRPVLEPHPPRPIAGQGRELKLKVDVIMEPTPDTTEYLILGYAVFFIVSAIYLVSLVIRNRNLKRDLETLEEMDRKN